MPAYGPGTFDQPHLYEALRARDARFDGRFFVGVTSTGVYCRPVCRVRTPLARNCRFFGSAALAEHAGFRPCLRCRPELAPGLAFVDSSRSLAAAAAQFIAQSVQAGLDVAVPALAARLGVTDRHLRRIFLEAHGVAPVDYIATQRLLQAKQLLTDTALPLTQVALASGFSSVRRFNAAFAERYRMTPGDLRRCGTEPPVAARGASRSASAAPAAGRNGPRAAAHVTRLGYRPPYDSAGMLRFFARRSLIGVEAVDEATLTLSRTLGFEAGGRLCAGWIEARFVPARHEVQLEIAPTLLPALGPLQASLRRALDLDADPQAVDAALAGLPGPGGVRLPGGFGGFEAAVRVIIGQQVTLAAARTLTNRLVQAFGTPIETPHAGLDRLFPSAQALAATEPDAIGRLGIVRQRVRALQALAAAVVAGDLVLEPGAAVEATLERLRALPGIGEWSAQLIALRALGWPDAFPAQDIGVLQALVPLIGRRDAKAALELAERWRPWRGYAVMRLWQSLESS